MKCLEFKTVNWWNYPSPSIAFYRTDPLYIDFGSSHGYYEFNIELWTL